MFKKLLKALGVGGPSVDTVLDGAEVHPGGTLTGRVHVKGGKHDVEIEHVTLTLRTRVEVESGDEEYDSSAEFARVGVSGPFTLAAEEERQIPFTFTVPFETPVTHVHGVHLHGMSLGVRTELSVAAQLDTGDTDAVEIHALPSQQRVLEALERLGFAFVKADLERGRVHGVHQELPFYQEIEFRPPPAAAGRIGQAELTFVADAHHLAVVLEADRSGGAFGEGADEIGRWVFPHEVALRTDWEGELGAWLESVAARAGHGGHHHHEHDDDHTSVGAAVASAGVGVAAGLVVAEVIDEIGDLFEDEEEEEEED